MPFITNKTKMIWSIKTTLIREHNPTGTNSGRDINALGYHQIRAVPNHRLQQARGLVKPPTTASFTAIEQHNPNPLGHGLVDRIQGILAAQDIVGVQLEDETGDFDLGALVAAGEEGSGLRFSWVLRVLIGELIWVLGD
jgi:hypothetical protein